MVPGVPQLVLFWWAVPSSFGGGCLMGPRFSGWELLAGGRSGLWALENLDHGPCVHQWQLASDSSRSLLLLAAWGLSLPVCGGSLCGSLPLSPGAGAWLLVA